MRSYIHFEVDANNKSNKILWCTCSTLLSYFKTPTWYHKNYANHERKKGNYLNEAGRICSHTPVKCLSGVQSLFIKLGGEHDDGKKQQFLGVWEGGFKRRNALP